MRSTRRRRRAGRGIRGSALVALAVMATAIALPADIAAEGQKRFPPRKPVPLSYRTAGYVTYGHGGFGSGLPVRIYGRSGYYRYAYPPYRAGIYLPHARARYRVAVQRHRVRVRHALARAHSLRVLPRHAFRAGVRSVHRGPQVYGAHRSYSYRHRYPYGYRYGHYRYGRAYR